MPKTVETKLTFTQGGAPALVSNIDKITEAIERLGLAVERAAAKLAGLSGAGIGGAGKDGVGKAAIGAPRSPFAPGGAIETGRVVTGYPTQKKGQTEREGRLYPGWHSGMRFAGGMVGAAGGIMGGITHQVTPAVGGLLTTAGGALSSVSIAGVPVGAIAGLGMMAAGTIMTAGSVAAQPAIQHFSQFADTYRMLGEDKAKRVKGIAKGGFTPDEYMRYGGMLEKAGAFEAFGTMRQVRYGKVAAEDMAQFMTTATGTGAAGGRQKGDYDYLAKMIYSGLDRGKNMVSMSESMQTLTDLMDMSAGYLGDIDKGQEKSLTGLAARLEASGTAMLKGPRGIQTMGGIMGRMSAEGTDAEEMLKWQAYQKNNPTGNYMDYLNWKADVTRAPGQYLKGLDVSKDEDVYEAMRLLGLKTPELTKKVIRGYQQGGQAQDDAEKAIAKDRDPDKSKGGKTDWDRFTSLTEDAKRQQFEFSTKVMQPYLEMETNLVKVLGESVGKVLPAAVAEFAKATKYLADHVERGDLAASLTKDVGKGLLKRTGESFEAVGNTLTFGGAHQLGEAIGIALFDFLHPSPPVAKGH
jgi:hypothetical protein